MTLSYVGTAARGRGGGLGGPSSRTLARLPPRWPMGAREVRGEKRPNWVEKTESLAHRTRRQGLEDEAQHSGEEDAD